MQVRFIILAFLGFFAQPASAEPHLGCTTQQVAVIDEALQAAKALTLKAAVAVGDNTHYTRWFGTYSPQNAEKVRAGLKSVVAAIRSGAVTVQCDQVVADGCGAGEYAFVFANRPYRMHLCPPFFHLPHLATLRPGAGQSENGTREGTLVHELSHFLRVAGTEDYCYSRRLCADMARAAPRRAINNADSFQYFTEDVTYFARQPLTQKPPPAPRP